MIIRFFIILYILSQTLNACVCSSQINSSYNDYKNYIITRLSKQEEVLKILKKSIETNKNTIITQINIIEKNNKILSNDLLEINRKIFEFKKQNEMR